MSTLVEKIIVMQAAADGKKIQVKKKGAKDWLICDFPFWEWYQRDYRIKLEPKEFWVNYYPNRTCCAYDSLKQATSCCLQKGKTIKVREVIE